MHRQIWSFSALTPIHMFISFLSSCGDPQADIVRPPWFIFGPYSNTFSVSYPSFCFFFWFAGLLVRLVAEELKEQYEET